MVTHRIVPVAQYIRAFIHTLNRFSSTWAKELLHLWDSADDFWISVLVEFTCLFSMMTPSETSVQTTNVQKTDTSRSMGVKVTTKTESTGIADNLELNPWYFKTVPGILKLVQLVSVYSFRFVFVVIWVNVWNRGVGRRWGSIMGACREQQGAGNCLFLDFKIH